MIQMYDTVYDLLVEFLPFFMLPIAILILRYVLSIVKGLMQVSYTKDLEEELMKHKDKPITETKINIDKDLQKYFNYKE